MAAQSSAKTGTGKKDVTPVKTATTSGAATGQPDQPAASAQQRPAEPQRPQRPPASARSGIRLNVGQVNNAVSVGTSSRSVKAIQYALADRGFEPGSRAGYYDQGTMDAYARYQDSINEHADGVPTESSLDYLGFDLI